MSLRHLLSTVVAYILIGVTVPPGNAQIAPDTTLPVNSVVTPNGNRFVIEGGTTSGNSLFHSFREFSVPSQQEAFFNNAPTIDNIITRVTGGQVSAIDGLIRANGTANLFLINPNGIVFGNNASLNLGGSFFGSTAESIRFADGSVFSASVPNAPPLLTINVPIGLQLGRNPGAIRVEGADNNPGVFPSGNTGLTVAPGRTLALVGGDVTLSGGILTADSGRIEVGSAANGTVSLAATPSGWRLGYNQVQEFRDIQLINGSLLGNSSFIGNPQSGIQIRGGRMVMERSQITTTTPSNQPGADIIVNASHLTIQDGGRIQTLSFADGAAGNVTVNADSMLISGFAPPSGKPCEDPSSRISSQNFGAGGGGNVSVSTRQLTLLNGGRVGTFVAPSATGKGGSVSVNATDSIFATSVNSTNPGFNSAIASETQGAGAGGDISVNTRQITLSDGAAIQSISLGSGTGGNVMVRASDAIVGTGVNPFIPTVSSGIQTQASGSADAGNLSVSTNRLTLQSGALLSSSAFIQPFAALVPGAGTGNTGDVAVSADRIEIVGDNLLLPLNANPSALGTATFGAGDAGNVIVSTRQLTLRDGGGLISGVFPALDLSRQPIAGLGTGNGGKLTVNASESISVIGASPLRSIPSILGTSTITAGNAGDMVINTPQLVVRDGGQVNSSTRASGAAGRVTINASESILVSGTTSNGSPSEVSANALIASDAFQQGLSAPIVPTGDTGELTINTSRLRVMDGGRVGVLHEGTGNAGTLRIQAESVTLERGGRISASTASGRGGNVRLNVRDLLLVRSRSQISAEAGGTGDGGNLTINTDVLALLEGSKITANAVRGKGGKIQINASGLLVSRDSTITASSQVGIDGVVTINTPEVELSSGLAELPTDVVDPSNQIIAGCPANRGNVFVVAGQGGLPPDPTQLLPGQAIWQDWRFLDNRGNSASASRQNAPQSRRITERSALTLEDSLPLRYRKRSSASLSRNPQSPPVEATSWVINQSGQVELVAQIPNQSSWYQPVRCDQ